MIAGVKIGTGRQTAGMAPSPNKISYEKEFTIVEAWLVVSTWRQGDTYPWMKKNAVVYLAPRAAFWVSIIVLFGHCVWAIHSNCNVNFQRGGSIITLLAAGLYAIIDWHDPHTMLLSVGQIKRLKIFNPYFILPLLAAVGTLVWGYGDLLPFFGTAGCNA
jgi:hypothetical protein